MDIQNKLLELFESPTLKNKGVPVGVVRLPAFKKYKKNSVSTALTRLEDKQYIECVGSTFKLTENGKKNWKKRKVNLQVFKSSFPKDASKNLLLIFDIPEARKAEREWFRLHLRGFDYKMVQRSVWVGPSPLPKEFLDYLKFIKLSHCVKTFKLVKSYIK